MKKLLALFGLALAMVVSASAQNQISFSNLPLVGTPAPMPNGYDGFNWTNILYVDAGLWSSAGPGYKLSSTPDQDVAFVGGSSCLVPGVQGGCDGSISVPSGNNNPLSFQLVSAIVAGGYGPTQITVLAYNHGNYVGSAVYNLGGDLQTINFPASWGNITQVTFQTQAMGDLVIYSFDAYFLLG